LTDSKSALLPG